MIHENFECELYLIRHGESGSNTMAGVMSGKGFDSDITPRGLEQARLLGLRLKREQIRFDRVYSSTYKRAVSTAETMLEAMGLPGAPFTTVADLREHEVSSEWRGAPLDEIFTPELRAYMAVKGAEFRTADGESLRNVQLRVSNWLEDEIIYNPELVEKDLSLKVAVVGHGTATQCLMQHILGFDERITMRITLANCSISRFRFDRRGWSLLTINDSLHIRETLV